MHSPRKISIEIIKLAEDGIISWEAIAMACLCYMSEDEVKDMAHKNEMPYSGANY